MPLLAAVTLGTFAVAMAFFLSETFIYHTVSMRAAIAPMVIAGEAYFSSCNTQEVRRNINLMMRRINCPPWTGVSIAWMGMGFNYYTRDVFKQG